MFKNLSKYAEKALRFGHPLAVASHARRGHGLSRRVLTTTLPTIAGGVLGWGASVLMPVVLHATVASPQITLAGVTEGTVRSGLIELRASADGPGIADLQFFASGQAVGNPVVNGTCQTDWDTSAIPSGSFTVVASGHTDAGLQVVSAPVLVHVRNPSPITNVAVTFLDAVSAAITWSTDLTSSSQVDFGETRRYDRVSDVDPTPRTEHRVVLTGLVPARLYYFRTRSRTWQNDLWLSPDYSFATTPDTAPLPPPAVSAPPASLCSTPDPFAAMGGGTCWGGGWFPPGSSVPASAAVSPAPAAVAAVVPAAQAVSDGTCLTPDPFAAMGGGVCLNSGWLPPGSAPAPAAPVAVPVVTTPAPVGASTVVPAPAAAMTCTTSDPFAAMGGGTCVNGGWLPPGAQIPAAVAPTAPAAPTPATPSASSGTCGGSDPFASMASIRGVCVGGGWVPVPR